ncbi:MAG TPA: energy transducer TonB [Acidobacteriaceae bacterium]|nr:energy transducer TonB [Acidobacteriaceae bacterium]
MGAVFLSLAICGTCLAHAQSKTQDHSSVGDAIIPPKILETVPAEYTDAARKSHVQGVCGLNVTLDKKGKVRKVDVSDSLGWGLDTRAVDAIRHYKFAPAMQNGKPIAVEMHVSVPFLIPGEKPPTSSNTIHVTQGISPVAIIHHVDPQYPLIARQSGIQGISVIGMTINTQGVPEDLEILRSAGPVLDSAAIEAVKKWRYRPFSINGKTVAIQTVVNVRFDLH